MECRLPGKLLSGSDSLQWCKFKQEFDIFLIASSNHEQCDKVKKAIFLNIGGEFALELYNLLKLTDSVTYNDVIKAFDNHFKPYSNVVFERYKFFQLRQDEGENIDSFVNRIKKQADFCKFEDKNIPRDIFVIGITDKRVKTCLLSETDLTFESAISITKKQLEVNKQVSEMVDKMKSSSLECNLVKSSGNGINCKFCGEQHVKGKCKAYNHVCNYCKKKHHFEKVCIKKKFAEQNKNRKPQDEIEVSEFNLDEVKEVNGRIYEWTEKGSINGIPINFKLDSGAQCNVIALSVLRRILLEKELRDRMKVSSVGLVAFGNKKIERICGEIVLKTNIRKKDWSLKFIVVDLPDDKAILGVNTCSHLNLIHYVNEMHRPNEFESKEDVINRYKKAFEGLGQFPGDPIHIDLKEGYEPKIFPIRRVAKSVLPKYENALKELEKKGVIEKVTGPCESLNNVVLAEKPNGDLRVCLDPKYLNQFILRHHYPIPSHDDILSDLHDKKYFSALDLKESFFQIRISNESSDLFAFGTPFGRYKFVRCPMGISPASEIFQRKNNDVFGDIEYVKIYIDDLYITAPTQEIHDRTLAKVLERAIQSGITFNESKFQFRQSSIKILGFDVSASGIKINDQRISAITNMKPPENVKQLQTYLGLVQYFIKFVPNLANLSAPLRELI